VLIDVMIIASNILERTEIQLYCYTDILTSLTVTSFGSLVMYRVIKKSLCT
jgi:hypothetical protein